MRRTRSMRRKAPRLLSAALLAAALPACARAAGPVPDPPPGPWRPGFAVIGQGDPKGAPLRVLTHTLEHCRELAHRAAALRAQAAAPNAEANLLASEGERLCTHGQLRPGIIRLRRAVMLLRGEPLPEPPAR